MTGIAEDGTMQERHHLAAMTMDDGRAPDDNPEDGADPLGRPAPRKPRLSLAEKKNLVFLSALYFIHAIPLQFSWQTMPILLRQQVSYSDLATFLTSQYPYSWKVAWSPLVDGFHFPFIGRRKTWIVPSLAIAAAVLLWLSFFQDSLVAQVAAGKLLSMAWIVLAWLAVMFLGANVRIALDSWSIDLLSPPNVHWVSPVATAGETLAGFVSFNTFLGVTSLSSPKDGAGKAAPASTRFFFQASASAFAITAVLLLVARRESRQARKAQTIGHAYKTIWNILKLRHVWILMSIHMASMIGFITNDTITVLELVKNNFDDFELAALATATLPFAVTGGILVTKSFKTRHPLQVWRQMFPWRLALAFVSQFTVLFISRYPDSAFRWLVVFVPFCLSRFFEATMWVAFIAFHAQLSDPQYGGIYMSLLSTTLNIRYDTLQFIFTKIIGAIDGTQGSSGPSSLIDGYQIVNATAVALAIPIYMLFLRPATVYLQSIEISAWRIEHPDTDPVAYEMVGSADDYVHEHTA